MGYLDDHEGYEPVTTEGIDAQKRLKKIIDDEIENASAEMDAAVKDAINNFRTKAAENLANAGDELEKLKVELADIRNAGATDTSQLEDFAKKAVVALNNRQKMLENMGGAAVSLVKRAIGLA